MVGGGVVGDEEVDDKLGDLHGGEVLLPPDAGTTGSGVVVVVHDDVNKQVDRDDNPLNRSGTLKLGVAEDCGCRVVEDVEEGKWLLLENEEDSVKELEVLDVVVDHVVGGQGWGESCGVADGPVEALAEVHGDAGLSARGGLLDMRGCVLHLLHDAKEENERSSREDDVVDLEEELELEGLARAAVRDVRCMRACCEKGRIAGIPKKLVNPATRPNFSSCTHRISSRPPKMTTK